MGKAEPVTGRARGEHGIGRAAGPLRVGAVRVEPEPERHADRVRQRLSSATALSTPPLIATALRPGDREARKTGPMALASASAASVSPPTAAASSKVNPTSDRESPDASAETIRSPSNPSRTNAKSDPRAESPMSSITKIQASRNRRANDRRECRLSRRSPQRQLGAHRSTPVQNHHGSAKAEPDFAPLGAGRRNAGPCRDLRPL